MPSFFLKQMNNFPIVDRNFPIIPQLLMREQAASSWPINILNFPDRPTISNYQSTQPPERTAKTLQRSNVTTLDDPRKTDANRSRENRQRRKEKEEGGGLRESSLGGCLSWNRCRRARLSPGSGTGRQRRANRMW